VDVLWKGSQIEKVRHRNRHLPDTVFEFAPSEYSPLDRQKAIDENVLFRRSIGEMADLVSRKKDEVSSRYFIRIAGVGTTRRIGKSSH
jgi:hypothetical protein